MGRLSLNPPALNNRARSASHSSAQYNAGRSLPSAPARPPHPQSHLAPPSLSIPSQINPSFTLAPPSLSPPSQDPPSPSLVVDNQTKERRAQVKKDLASIITKPPNPHPHPGGHPAHANTETLSTTDAFQVSFPPHLSVPAQPTQPRTGYDGRSLSAEFDVFNTKFEPSSVACPICGDSFQNERILAVHIDDAHGLGSVVGPNASGKKVHFASGNQRASGGQASADRSTPTRNPLNASIDALDLSFSSPLGKSRSVDDIRDRTKKAEDMGFEGFGMIHKPGGRNELPKR